MNRNLRSMFRHGKKKAFEEHLIPQKLRWIFNPQQHFNLEDYKNGWREVERKQCKQSWRTDQSPRTFFQLLSVLLSWHWMQNRWLLSIQMSTICKHWLPIISFMATRTYLPTYVPTLPTTRRNFVDHRTFFWPTEDYAYLNWDRFNKGNLPSLNNRQKWPSMANENLKEGDLVWLINNSSKRR